MAVIEDHFLSKLWPLPGFGRGGDYLLGYSTTARPVIVVMPSFGSGVIQASKPASNAS
jgi:hypothetical protein